MRFESPVAKNSKDEVNIYKISNKVLHPDSKEPTVFQVEASRFEYPQVESVNEAFEICGGETPFLDRFNEFLRESAVDEGKLKIRLASTGDEESIINAALAACKNFTLIQEEKLAVSEIKDRFSALRDIAGKSELSDAEMVALMKKQLGIA